MSFDAKAFVLQWHADHGEGLDPVDATLGVVAAAFEAGRASEESDRLLRQVRMPGDLFVTLVRNPDESMFVIDETIRFLGDHPDNDGDIEFYESLDGSVRGWVAPTNVKPVVSK